METFHNNSRIIHVQPINVTNDEEAIEVMEETTIHLSTNDETTISTTDPTNNVITISVSDPANNEITISTIDPKMLSPQDFENTPILPKNAKSNKNLISFTGVLVLGSYFSMIMISSVGSRYGWYRLSYGEDKFFYTYVNLCCVPVILPLIYFMCKPRYLIKALKHMKLL